MEKDVFWADQGPLELHCVSVETSELSHVLREDIVNVRIMSEVNLRVTRLWGSWVLAEYNFITTLVHVGLPEVNVAYARVIRLVSVRPNAQKPDSKFKSVFCCVEGLRILIVHVFEDCVHDEVRLFVVYQHQQSEHKNCNGALKKSLFV